MTNVYFSLPIVSSASFTSLSVHSDSEMALSESYKKCLRALINCEHCHLCSPHFLFCEELCVERFET